MKERSELKRLLVMTGLFVAVYYLPVGTTRFDGAVHEALALADGMRGNTSSSA
jgi:hypothetical protein